MLPSRFLSRTTGARIICAVVLVLTSASPARSRSIDPSQSRLTGAWVLWERDFKVDLPTRIRIESRADSLVVLASGGVQLTGRTIGDRLILTGTADKNEPVSIDLRWQGDSLVGTTKMGSETEPAWLVRERTRPSSAPTRQLFRPTAFPRVFSSAIPPALRIWPGDTLRTETVSAGGIDSAGTRRSNSGNPLTGPFFIEGALPGDVVAVHLLRVRTNSTSAKSDAGLAWSTVTPDYIGDFKEAEDSGSTWVIDAAARTARLKTPSDALRNYVVALRPMLGCIGVAPGAIGRAETRSSGVPGRHGGNMDYNQVVEGSTVYLQVSQPGAFLFLGDGHAAQGAGELNGSALETPMDVEFSVELIRDKRIGFPRIESASHIMSVGIGGSLDRAFQVATTGLAGWLEEEYKLTRSEAAMVMGTAVEYDIAEVVDGDVNVVAKMPKSVMRGVSVRR